MLKKDKGHSEPSKERQQTTQNEMIQGDLKPVVIDDQSKSVIAFTSQMIRTLQITIPLMIASSKEEDELFDDDDSEMMTTPLKQHPHLLEKSVLSKVAPGNLRFDGSIAMGELLFPSFN